MQIYIIVFCRHYVAEKLVYTSIFLQYNLLYNAEEIKVCIVHAKVNDN